MSDVEHVLGARNRLGEGPLWSVEEQSLYWVDIENETFWRWHPETGSHEMFHVGTQIGVLALRAGGGLVMATQKGFGYWDERSQNLTIIAHPEAEQPQKRFNDGAVDCRGRFWAGTMNIAEGENRDGVLYRLDLDGSVHVMETGIGVSNGIGWSPDNTIMYFTDSPRRTIYAYAFDAETGNITNATTFVKTPEGEGFPDGLTVDSEGYVWSAFWDGAKIVRYTPRGEIERVIQMPVLRPTSCVFGGPNLDELYITSAWSRLSEQQREQYPLSGDVFRVKAGVRGLEKYKFGG